jgi:hypothetical protein
VVPGRIIRNLNPAGTAATRDAHPHELAERAVVDSVVSVTHDRAVDVFRDDENHGSSRLHERSFHLRGVEEPECQIQRLSETPIVVVIDFSSVHDGTDSKQSLRSAYGRDACIVIVQELVESRDCSTEQKHLRSLVNRIYESENAVASIDEPVTMLLVDSSRTQCRIEQFIYLSAELGLNGVGTASRPFDVERNYGPVMRQTSRARRLHRCLLRECVTAARNADARDLRLTVVIAAA